jgi:hypothetical protein
MSSLTGNRPVTTAMVNRPQDDPLGSAIGFGDNANLLARQRLDLFRARCHDLIERVNVGSIGFIEGVDLAYSAAIWSSLVDDVGDDAVQAVMRDAFLGVRRP